MKTALLVTIFAVAAFASRPDHSLLGRQFTPIDPGSAPEECRAAVSSAASSLPPEPTKLAEFSSSYYETTSRTATAGGEDCAWLTEVPEELYTEVTDYTDDLIEWMKEGENAEAVRKAGDACASAAGVAASGIGGTGSPCKDELKALATKIEDATGWEPDLDGRVSDSKDGDDDKDGNDEEPDSGANNFVPQMYAAAAMVAAFIGVVARL